MFHKSAGSAYGSSRRQKRCQADSRNTRAASASSGGIVFIDWYRLNAMFHACDVNIANTAAHSTPSRLPGNRAMNGAMAIAWKPRIGTDCSTSKSGTMIFSAVRQRVATTANTNVNKSAAPSAVNMRRIVRSR